MDRLVASSATALLACVRSVALRTVHGSTITQALAVLTNGQPLYLYLVDEVSGEVVVGGDDGRRGGEGVYPIPIHPSDTSLLTSMLPLLVGGLKLLAHERRGRYVDNATRTWMEDALDMNEEEMGVRMFEDMACKDATHESVRGAALRRLKLWFLEKDPTESFAGLERVLVGDGQVRWTSHVNAQRIRRHEQNQPNAVQMEDAQYLLDGIVQPDKGEALCL
ncbi:hypothetical protein DYB36_013432 [Aphanomyces astaci]|uniref:Uncharacterized protein n=1 Tax=Aphanomyces astaci TaxID=112090 RepID=A0A397AJU8_APHAT|nr:hypothetical protein DYB36_013432 [Aphanomyces astaci]